MPPDAQLLRGDASSSDSPPASAARPEVDERASGTEQRAESSWIARKAGTPARPETWLERVARRFRPVPAAEAQAEGLPAAILDAVSDPFVVLDADDRVRAVNAAAQAMLGHRSDALVGFGFAERVLPPAHRDAYRDRLQSWADAGREGDRWTLPVVRADGTESVAELSIRRVAGAGGPLFGVCLRDATDDEATGRESESQRRTLHAILDALPTPVVALNRSGRVVFMNQASTQGSRAGARAESVLAAQRWSEADAVMQSGVPAFDQEETDRAGDLRLTTRVPVRSRSGAVVGVVVLSRDATAQQAAEARLLDGKRQAEAAARASGELLATTSHEIRTLMSGVTGMTTLLLDTDLDPEQQDFVDTIRTSSDALLAVVNDVLDLSKIEAGMLEIDEQPFSPEGAIEEALAMVAQQGAAKGLALTGQAADDVPETVFGDPMRVRQVLANLLTNAVKFTDEGSVRVHVEAEPGADPGALTLAFAVQDTGVGIAPDRLEAVFDEFVQADDSTARTHGGTGLGLAICRRLVGMMGGEMRAESAPGGGSVFRFTVSVGAAPRTEGRPGPEVPARAPAVPTPATAPAPDADRPQPERAEVMQTDSILPAARVLLAEDDPVMRKVTGTTLRRLGYRPTVVVDGAKAVLAVRHEPFDLVLMDIMMPVMDGFEAARRIRADPGRHPAPAIVALTANAMKGDRERCLEAGCDDYLSKPVAPQTLAATIERAIRERTGASVAE
ncbi:ATP-binding protein [Rubrivirga sp.]|uniref:ATP-binding protein n=1 Tax=Rubrivirga sp. TaxID=1885344 RepID=UPI003B52B786